MCKCSEVEGKWFSDCVNVDERPSTLLLNQITTRHRQKYCLETNIANKPSGKPDRSDDSMKREEKIKAEESDKEWRGGKKRNLQ